MAKHRFSLEIPEHEWEEDGPDDAKWARLRIGSDRLTIAGCSMHLEAIAVEDVEEDGSTLRRAAMTPESDRYFEREVDAIHTLRGDDPPDPIEIRGREYVLVAYPIG